jgi:hypothetical protein
LFYTLFSSDEQLNRHRHTPMPFSIIHVFPLKQISALQAKTKREKKNLTHS